MPCSCTRGFPCEHYQSPLKIVQEAERRTWEAAKQLTYQLEMPRFGPASSLEMEAKSWNAALETISKAIDAKLAELKSVPEELEQAIEEVSEMKEITIPGKIWSNKGCFLRKNQNKYEPDSEN